MLTVIAVTIAALLLCLFAFVGLAYSLMKAEQSYWRSKENYRS